MPLARIRSLLRERFAQVFELAGAAEEVVSRGDELRVFGDEELARGAEVELPGIVAEELAVDAGPDEAAVRIDVDFRNAELGCGKILFGVYAH